jgi:hypothetical protein
VPKIPLLRTALAAAFSLTVLVPATASAADGTYTVWACKSPSGAPIPTAGWVASASAEASATDGCSSGGPFALALNAGPHGGQGSQWAFWAPPSTRIAAFNMLRVTQGFAGPSNTSLGYTVAAVGSAPDDNIKELERCFKEGDACQSELTAPVGKPGLDAKGLTIDLKCALSAFAACPSPASSVSINQATVTLRDLAKPTVANNRVVDAGESSGSLRVRFDAADQGGGLYRANTLVDGKPFSTVALGAHPCEDADVSNGDAYEFLHPQPCPASVTGTEVAVDHRQLPPGPHTIQTEVEDAAGHTAAVSVTQFPKVNLDGGGSGSGIDGGGQQDYERLRQATVKAGFVQGKKRPRSLEIKRGDRSVIRGRVADRKGRGIVGARVDVYHVTKDGKRRLVKTGLKTRAKGRLTYIVSKKIDTRRIELTFRALRPGPITSRARLTAKVMHKGKPFYFARNAPKKSSKSTAKKSATR